MDVVCGRCRAEYEFDNALISERGTTVRCTNCGLQFKIFPPVGQRDAELWRVYRVEQLDQPVLEYSTLEELQKGIAKANVRRSDWLARGDGSPRPLAEIVELQPLLGQRNSELPPPVEMVGSEEGSIPAVLRLGSSGTVIGMPPTEQLAPIERGIAPPEPLVPTAVEQPSEVVQGVIGAAAIAIDDLSSEVHNALVEDWVESDEEAAVVVPSLFPEGEDDVEGERSSRPSDELVPAGQAESQSRLAAASTRDAAPRRRVRSALTQGKGRAKDASASTIRPQRTPLLSRTFIGGATAPAELEPPSSGRRAASYPPPLPDAAPITPKVLLPDKTTEAVPRSAALEPNAIPSQRRAASDAGSGGGADQVGSVEDRPDREQHLPSEASHEDATTDVVQASQDAPAPRVSDASDRGSSPYLRRDRMSSSNSLPRTAAFSVVVVLVAAAAGGFLIWSQIKSSGAPARSKAPELAHESPAAVATSPAAEGVAHASKDFSDRFVALETVWWTNVLTGRTDVALADDSTRDLLSMLGSVESWERVNVLRAGGKLGDARQLAMKLSTSGAEYALATLDLIETDDPPWALVRDHFKEAAVGEPAPYFARTGYIFATARSGGTLAAAAEYENLSKMHGATETPLFAALGAFLERTQAVAPALTASSSSATAEVSGPSKPQATESEALPADGQPKKKDVPSAVKAKVEQADTLWRSGNRDQAVVLYRQVVAEIGTGHFLGQRSAARVAQAERERGTAPGASP